MMIALSPPSLSAPCSPLSGRQTPQPHSSALLQANKTGAVPISLATCSSIYLRDLWELRSVPCSHFKSEPWMSINYHRLLYPMRKRLSMRNMLGHCPRSGAAFVRSGSLKWMD